MIRIRPPAACAVLALLAAASCRNGPRTAPAVRESPRHGGTVNFSLASDPKSFNPIVAKETTTTAVTGYIFEGLTRTDGATLEVKPALAERWESDRDGTIWTFHLRRDAVWHDGTPFSADDVVFTFERLIYNEAIPTSSRDVLLIGEKPIRVEKIDAHTVRFVLPDRFAPFLRLTGQEILPRHALEKAVAAGTFPSTWGIDEKPERIVGTGPFVLADYRPGEWVVLDRNPRYWRRDETGARLPYLDRIVHLVIADRNMALLKFRAGELDAVSVTGQDYPVIKPLEKRLGFTVYTIGPSLGEEFIVFNLSPRAPIPAERKGWFSDVSFRRAVAHLLDRASMAANVYGGLAVPQEGPLSASAGFFHNPRVRKYGYDPAEAGRILAGAGFVLKNGRLYDTKGREVRFSLLVNSNNNERVQIANIVQNDLRKAGMAVNLLVIDFNTLVTKIGSTGDWDAVMIGLTGGIEPHGGRNVWHSTGQLHMWNPRPGDAAAPWEREIDRIFDDGARELDPARRKVLYDRWQEIAAEELPFLHTVNPLVMTAVRNRFAGLKPSVYGGVFHNIEEIRLDGGGTR